jgi:hypothetical protein
MSSLVGGVVRLAAWRRISLQQAQVAAHIQLENNPPVNLQFNKVKQLIIFINKDVES